MNSSLKIFGSMVFSDEVMRERLPENTYAAVQNTMVLGKRLQADTAEQVAAVMRDWAIEKGATHFSHWFQPMTGVTAEKHDSFLTMGKDGRPVEEFSGKELIQGEPDASSFPSGGLRATFEARGYTAWDPTSYAFVKDGVLCIPTAFCSYGGEALDKKTPLLRSMEALNKQALRILRLFGDDSTSVTANAGAEQEYFLIDRKVFDRRIDLLYTGRTLFGARPPKGQELDDHYFGTVKPKVASFMKELNEEMWKLGVYARTEHNEAAPGQHELALHYSSVNVAADQNQLAMEIMKKVAEHHDMVCLLHEKPFSGVSGSGKHNNWSLSTSKGENLLDPGETPDKNARFLTFLCAVIAAVDRYQGLLRASVAGPGNDLRLGGSEAPPAILSVYLGQELSQVLDSIENGTEYCAGDKITFKVGVHALPRFPKDSTDRNRTSPFAFTGNKFEFRMPGAPASISDANVVLNTAVADILAEFADRLEKAENFDAALHTLLSDTIREHRRILFNGNGYDEAWVKEAARRGLRNLPATTDCVDCLIEPDSIELFARHKVFSESELKARREIILENYAKVIRIEARTVLRMANMDILPAVSRYTGELAETVNRKLAACPGISVEFEMNLIRTLNELLNTSAKILEQLTKDVEFVKSVDDPKERALFYKDCILKGMNDLRICSDKMEKITDRRHWPYPTTGEILFSIR